MLGSGFTTTYTLSRTCITYIFEQGLICHKLTLNLRHYVTEDDHNLPKISCVHHHILLTPLFLYEDTK